MGLRKPTSFPVKCVSLPLKSLQIMLGAGKHGTKDRKSDFFSPQDWQSTEELTTL